MTKEEIDKLFEAAKEGNIEDFLSFVSGELKIKMNQCNNKEKFFYDNEEEIYQNIAANIPKELYEYLIEKSIESNFSSIIVNLGIDDKRKIELMDEFESDFEKAEIALAIKDPKIKLKSLDKISGSFFRREVAISIKDVECKLKSLEKFDDDIDSKEFIVESLTEDEIDEISKIDFQSEKEETKELIDKAIKKNIDRKLIKKKVEEFTEKNTGDRIGLPDNITIGVELETEGKAAESFRGMEVVSGWKRNT